MYSPICNTVFLIPDKESTISVENFYISRQVSLHTLQDSLENFNFSTTYEIFKTDLKNEKSYESCRKHVIQQTYRIV